MAAETSWPALHSSVLLPILLGLLVAYLLLSLVRSRSPLDVVPGPWLSRYSGWPLTLAVLAGNRIHYIDALHQRYGKFVRIAPNEIAVNDAASFKQIHGVPGYEKSAWYQGILVMVDMPALFAMPNRAHAVRRRLFARAFSKTHIRQYWEGAVRERVELAVARMLEKSQQDGSVDVLQWWVFMTTDISAELMFGESFRTLERGEVNEFIRAISLTLMGGGIAAELPIVRKIGSKLPFKAAQELFNTGDFLMANTSMAVKNMKAAQGGRNVFANMVAESEKGEDLTEADVQNEAMNLLVAGSDTTANTLTYLVWAVSSRPELRDALQSELKGLPNNYVDGDLERLPLLSAVIEETLRLYGAAPGALPRVVPAGGATFGQYYFPEGTVVTTQGFSFNRDPDLFPNPHEFQPSRWLQSDHGDGRDTVSEQAKAIFHPFGAGARSCLGIHLAYMELRLGVVEFFRRCPGAKPAPSATPKCMELENYFLIKPRGHKCDIILG